MGVPSRTITTEFSLCMIVFVCFLCITSCKKFEAHLILNLFALTCIYAFVPLLVSVFSLCSSLSCQKKLLKLRIQLANGPKPTAQQPPFVTCATVDLVLLSRLAFCRAVRNCTVAVRRTNVLQAEVVSKGTRDIAVCVHRNMLGNAVIGKKSLFLL